MTTPKTHKPCHLPHYENYKRMPIYFITTVDPTYHKAIGVLGAIARAIHTKASIGAMKTSAE